MEEFRKWMYGEIEIPSKSILITVDDGAMGTGKHNGNKLNPLLEEYHMNATLFLITFTSVSLATAISSSPFPSLI